MSHTVVKINADEDGEPTDDKRWHLISPAPSDEGRTLCDGTDMTSISERVHYASKEVARGGISCADCLEIVKKFKSIKL